MRFFCTFIVFAFLLLSVSVSGQKNNAYIQGQISDSSGTPAENIRIQVVGQKKSAVTDAEGRFRMAVPSGETLQVSFMYAGMPQKVVQVPPIKPDSVFDFGKMHISARLGMSSITITGGKLNDMQTMNPHNFDYVPNVAGGIEGTVKNFAGVSSNNELSSQYSVRGGSFDENLVYLNDIEIYRPQLIRAGQEEGLSIINTDMVQSLAFSAGGFEAKYGDKLSSVLDIHYKVPDSFALRTDLSLLGAAGELEGCSKDKRFTYMLGVRYRNSQYLLSSLDVQGEYLPSFVDGQGYFTYKLNDKLSVDYLTYYGNNQYLSVPQSQTTQFGTVSQALQLVIAFGGQQILQYSTLLNGLTFDYKPAKGHDLKFITSFYTSSESEDYDILGGYELQELDNQLDDAGFGKASYTFGAGEFLYHARNSFYTEIYNNEVKGKDSLSPNAELLWGLKYQHEHIESALNEFQYIDSVDYSVPQSGNPRTTLPVYQYLYSRQNADWNRYSGYAQTNLDLNPEYNSSLSLGVRGNYWDFNHEFLVSPRVQYRFEPNAGYNRRIFNQGLDDSLLRKQIVLKASAGIYSQPPFFKELFAPDGSLVPGIKAQKSAHLVLGQDLTFKMWDRPFKFTTELYSKYLWDVIPYTIDDVHITYLGANDAIGYATGADFQLHGDLVKDEPSWVSLSFLKTAENINGQGYIPMPTDQRVRFSMFFQDFLPDHPSYKVHLNLVFGSGLPFGPPGLDLYKDVLRIPPYERADIGFSRMFWDRSKKKSNSKVLNAFRSIWVSLEVFNLLGINNTVSYLWVSDISGNQWAVPNYLTSRRLNLQLEMKF